MYRKNTAGQTIGFVAINASTGAIMTGTTGFAAFRVLDGGAQASAGGTVTDKGNGQYSFALAQADTNGNDCSILFTMTGMIAAEKTFITTAADPTDAVHFGLSALPNASANANGGLPILSSGATTLAYTVSTLTTYTGNTLQTGDSYARLGAPSGASIAADVAAVYAKTTNLPAAPADEALVIAATNAIMGRIGAPVGASISADIQTRSTYAGGAVASVTAPVTVGTNNDKSGYSLNLAQTGLTPRALDTVADSALTVGDALVAALCGAAGKESISGTVYTIETPFTGTVIRTFTLNSSTAPSART